MHPLKRIPALPKGPFPWATGHFRTLNCSEKIAFGVIFGMSRWATRVGVGPVAEGRAPHAR